MYQDIVDGKKKIAVVGLGYVGLPIALELAKKASVIGFDINEARLEHLRNHNDHTNELDATAFEGTDISFTNNIDDLRAASFYIIAVPTPVDQHNVPNLTPVLMASETVGKVLEKGDYVVYESTVYPGCTEEDCLPILEEKSGLTLGEGFKLGYSPERINPGDKKHTLQTVIKVASGSDTEALEHIAKVYELVVTAGVHRATSIKVAEAAKIIENTQRDLNIALMNELSMIFDKMDINTLDVLEAAGTKWNFGKYYPGLVGGHCIGVDPYYLTYKSEKLGYKSRVVLSGRIINDQMPSYVAKKVVQHLIRNTNAIKSSRVLVMGVTFKENITDIRNSKVVDVIRELKEYEVNVDVVDAFADKQEMKGVYDMELSEAPSGKYDAVILAVSHNDYCNKRESFFDELLTDNGLLYDIKGLYRNQFKRENYWTL